MLRGRCSCGISGLPTSSPALQSLLTPLFPLLTRNAPVSLFFPLLTQKQGSGGSPEVKEAKEVKEVENLAFLTPAFTTTSINIVGAPTFPFLHTSARLQERFASLLRRASRGDPFQPSTFNFEPPFSPKSSYSRTSERLARKPNHSRTYAKTGGWGAQKVFSCNSFVFYHHVNHYVKYNCRRADIPVSARHLQIARAARLISDQEAGIEDDATTGPE
jgi:hypothetical protein